MIINLNEMLEYNKDKLKITFICLACHRRRNKSHKTYDELDVCGSCYTIMLNLQDARIVD